MLSLSAPAIVTIVVQAIFIPVFILILFPIAYMILKFNVVVTRRMLFLVLLPAPFFHILALATGITFQVFLELHNQTQDKYWLLIQLIVLFFNLAIEILGDIMMVIQLAFVTVLTLTVCTTSIISEKQRKAFIGMKVTIGILIAVFIVCGLTSTLSLTWSLVENYVKNNSIREIMSQIIGSTSYIIGIACMVSLTILFIISSVILIKKVQATFEKETGSAMVKRIATLTSMMTIAVFFCVVSTLLRPGSFFLDFLIPISVVISKVASIVVLFAVLLCYGPLRDLSSSPKPEKEAALASLEDPGTSSGITRKESKISALVAGSDAIEGGEGRSPKVAESVQH